MTTNQSLHADTQQNLSRINNQLDALVDITGTSKQLAGQIGHELEEQNQMLADANRHMDITQNNVNRAVIQVQEVRAKSSTCWAWILSIILLIGIILVWILL